MRHRQIICGISISLFLLIWLCTNLLINGITAFFIGSAILTAFLVASVFVDSGIMRILQGYLFLFEAVYIFSVSHEDLIIGWFFLISGIVLLALYGFFHKHFVTKAAITSLLICISLFYTYAESGNSAYPVIQILCVISMLPVIGLDNLKRVVYDLPDYKTLTEELKIREAEVDDLEIQLENQKFTLSTEMKNREVQLINEIERLKGIIDREGETEKLKAELEVLKAKAYALEKRNTELEAEIKSKREGIISDYCNIEERLEKIQMLHPLTRGEKNLVIKFYLSRGAATNAMLSEELSKSETTIKNTFRSTFRKLNVPSRSALMGQLDDWMNKSVNGIAENDTLPFISR